VVLNVTVTNPTDSSYLTVWPTGSPRPTASNVNFVAGQTVPNLVVAEVGRGGTVNIFNFSGNVDVVADIAGYFPDTDDFVPVVPARVLETRRGFKTVDGVAQRGVPLSPVDTLNVPMLGRGGVPTRGVDSVVLNVTVTNVPDASYLTVWPTGSPRPTASNLNMVAGDTVPNLVVAKLGTGGSVSFFNATGAVDVIADVAGYFPTGGAYVSLVPARILETRPGLQAVSGGMLTGTPIGEHQTLDLPVLGIGGVPAEAVSAVVLNVTAISPTAPSYITVWPTGAVRPTASNLNVGYAGQVVPNLVIAKVGADGRVSIYNDSGSTDMVVDVAGYFNAEFSFVRDIAVTDRSTCALHELGGIDCWGEHTQDYGYTPRAGNIDVAPHELGIIDDAVEMAVGSASACALRSTDRVWCWGANSLGQLGDGTISDHDRYTPQPVVDLGDVVDIDASSNSTCAVTADGGVDCWGSDAHGVARPQPVAVGGLTDIVQVSVGDNATCALHETGTVSCWGVGGSLGLLGDGLGRDSDTPVAVAGLTDADSIEVMATKACATRTNSQAVCWGGSFLGNAATGSSLTPVAVLDGASGQPATDIVQMAGGNDYLCALRFDAQLYCLGSPTAAALGLAPAAVLTTTLTAPTAHLPESYFIAAGADHICALTFDSELFCWGANGSGQVGNGTVSAQTIPTLILD